ncbi:Protein required for attachment to host cells [Noviherbaspirillum humi]|uniref:Protein required for attachment to host cells n=2 Tax=Noviherbaspirillum humi TaxID=1688639 RepID=A0A239KN82_9BURK|nr:Protein required for attachment to host cells [Noviherbaspirillum humi]
MVNEAARLDANESETDRLGPTSAGQSMHNTGGALPNKTYEPDTTPDKKAAEIFAKDVAKYLQECYREGRFKHLAVVASPKFLGALRSELDGPVGSTISVEIDKDYTSFGPEQLRDQIKLH